MKRAKKISKFYNLAIDRDFASIAKLLINNEKTNLELSDKDGQTALMKGTSNIDRFKYKILDNFKAVAKENIAYVKSLVLKKVDVNKQNNNKQTALFIGILNF